MMQVLADQSTLLTGIGITRISVRELFGQYSYELRDKVSRDGLASKALMLYGDNGSGKTTILTLLFYLLSHLEDKGHKTKVSNIRFTRFQVDFSDGSEVAATRADSQKKHYNLSVKRNGKEIASCTYPDTDSSIERARAAAGGLAFSKRDMEREE